jgi:hypothetical protein
MLGSNMYERLRFVVAAELHYGETSSVKEGVRQPPPAAVPVQPRPRQPPTALNLSKVYEIESQRSSSGTSYKRDSVTSNNRDSATSGSLNLSQHNTGSQVL